MQEKQQQPKQRVDAPKPKDLSPSLNWFTNKLPHRFALLATLGGGLGASAPAWAENGKAKLGEICGLDAVETIPLIKSGNEIISASAKEIAMRLLTSQEITGPIFEQIVTEEVDKIVPEHFIAPFAELMKKKDYAKATDYIESYSCLYTGAEIEITIGGEGIRKTGEKFLKEKLGESLGKKAWEAIERDFPKEVLEKRLEKLLEHAWKLFSQKTFEIMYKDIRERSAQHKLTKTAVDRKFVGILDPRETELRKLLQEDTAAKNWIMDLAREDLEKRLKDAHSPLQDIGKYVMWKYAIPELDTEIQNDPEIQQQIITTLIETKTVISFWVGLENAKDIIHFSPSQQDQLLKKLEYFNTHFSKANPSILEKCEWLIKSQ